jgi:lipopolysaccharide biosynthesis glycosyltransferase
MPSAPDAGSAGKGNEHAVVLCIDRAMLLPALSVATDAAAQATGYDVVLLVDKGGIPPGFGKWHEDRGTPFRVEEVDFGAWVVDELRPTPRFPRASAFRLVLTKYFADRYRRLLFLDGDLRLCSPLSGLFRLDLGGKVLAAANAIEMSPLTPDGQYLAKGVPTHIAALGFPPGQHYLNAGVMLIDASEWERRQVSEKAIDFIVRNREACTFIDQDGINAALAGDHAVLSPGWNRHPVQFRDRRGRFAVETHIFHYFGESKPWNPGWSGEHARHFANFFAGLWPGALGDAAPWRPPTAPTEPPPPLVTRLARSLLPTSMRYKLRQAFGREERHPSMRAPGEADALIARYLADTPFIDVVQGLSPRPWIARRYRR